MINTDPKAHVRVGDLTEQFTRAPDGRLKVDIRPTVMPDGSYLFHNGVDDAVVIPVAFVPSNPASLDALMAAIKLSPYGKTVNNAFGVPQYITVQIPP